MKIKIILSLLLLCGAFSANAEDILRGRVVDGSTGEPIAFANIFLPGTTHGTSSDTDGYFSIGVTDLMEGLSLRVSAVGYATRDIDITTARNSSGPYVVELEPVVYLIGGAEIYGESLLCQRTLRSVVENISKNYISKPYNYTGYFIEKRGVGSTSERFREAEVEIYNSYGYRWADPATIFADESCRFNEVRRNFDVESAYDGLTFMDDILAMDVVKSMRSVLDYENKDYRLSDRGVVSVDGREVRMISFTVANPTLANGAVGVANNCYGEIYIDSENYAVLQYHAVYELDGRSYLGYDFVTGEGVETPNTLDVFVTYKAYASKYVLSGVFLRCNDMTTQFITTGVETDNPERISGRTYFEASDLNSDFWQSYSVSGI